MAYFDEFANGLEEYPKASVKLSIVSLAVVPPFTGPKINMNEIWKFKVRVTNSGPLNLTLLSLKVQGQNGATVSTTSGGPFAPSLTTSGFWLLNVNAESSQDSGFLYFTAPNAAKPAETDLIKATINDYTANLDHILTAHSVSSDPPAGIYEAEVFPS